ncbi:hypothetical protein R1sor_001546 [Riccia sorocarpa]|uniref:FCP1 homology domain-containing protein n=1 Tax=Riccia sorocarpa TaxID=122646 RepID=A0ABD3H271_9MARC
MGVVRGHRTRIDDELVRTVFDVPVGTRPISPCIRSSKLRDWMPICDEIGKSTPLAYYNISGFIAESIRHEVAPSEKVDRDSLMDELTILRQQSDSMHAEMTSLRKMRLRQPLLSPGESRIKTLVLDIFGLFVCVCQTQSDREVAASMGYTVHRLTHPQRSTAIYYVVRGDLSLVLDTLVSVAEVIIWTSRLREYTQIILDDMDVDYLIPEGLTKVPEVVKNVPTKFARERIGSGTPILSRRFRIGSQSRRQRTVDRKRTDQLGQSSRPIEQANEDRLRLRRQRYVEEQAERRATSSSQHVASGSQRGIRRNVVEMVDKLKSLSGESVEDVLVVDVEVAHNSPNHPFSAVHPWPFGLGTLLADHDDYVMDRLLPWLTEWSVDSSPTPDFVQSQHTRIDGANPIESLRRFWGEQPSKADRRIIWRSVSRAEGLVLAGFWPAMCGDVRPGKGPRVEIVETFVGEPISKPSLGPISVDLLAEALDVMLTVSRAEWSVGPTADPIVDSGVERSVRPVADPLPEPLVDSGAERSVRLVANPLLEPLVDTGAEGLVEPVADPLLEPLVNSGAKGSVGPIADPLRELLVDNGAEGSVGAVADPFLEPLVDSGAEGSVWPILDPSALQIAQTVAELVAEGQPLPLRMSSF